MSELDAKLLASLAASVADIADAKTLPASLYVSPQVLQVEKEALFMREWLAVGRAERIPAPGDWFTVDPMEEPIIVVRDKEGSVRAMSAVCQHRAMQVCEGEGNSSTFKCPYHHWIYGQDGRLLGSPAMERTADFDKAEYGLPPLAVEEWQGFIFVNFDTADRDLDGRTSLSDPWLDRLDRLGHRRGTHVG